MFLIHSHLTQPDVGGRRARGSAFDHGVSHRDRRLTGTWVPKGSQKTWVLVQSSPSARPWAGHRKHKDEPDTYPQRIQSAMSETSTQAHNPPNECQGCAGYTGTSRRRSRFFPKKGFIDNKGANFHYPLSACHVYYFPGAALKSYQRLGILKQ